MPKVQEELPEKVAPYKFHGLSLTKATKGNYTADCPFCGNAGKFSVKQDNGMAKCWTCGVGSGNGGLNTVSFLRELYTQSLEATTMEDYDEIATEFNLLFQETPKEWGLAKSISSGRWIAPGFSFDGRVMTLYHLTRIKLKGKFKNVWLPTPHQGQHLCYQGTTKFKKRIYLCEGLKDGMCWWEVLTHAKEGEDGKLTPTAKRAEAIIKGSTVIVVTGVNVFKDDYLKLFKGKEVIFMFDSDQPTINEKSGKTIPPAGLEGVKRFASKLNSSKTKPESMKWLDWGGTGLGYDPSIPNKTDIRDFLTKDQIDA